MMTRPMLEETGVMNYDGINVYGDEVTTNIKEAQDCYAGAITQSQSLNSIPPM
jgi:hypothetical protein